MKNINGLLMADLSGFTAMTEIHGDRAGLNLIDKFTRMGRNSLMGKCILLEKPGDMLFIASKSADDLAKTAIELKRNSEKALHFLGIHCGLHYGTTIEQSGSLYGSAVNFTARIVAHAKENKILCSKSFVNALVFPEAFQLIPQANIRFKNVRKSAEIFELQPAIEEKVRKVHIDPVCHMRLNEGETAFSYIDNMVEYFFCSEECKKIYQEHEGEVVV